MSASPSKNPAPALSTSTTRAPVTTSTSRAPVPISTSSNQVLTSQAQVSLTLRTQVLTSRAQVSFTSRTQVLTTQAQVSLTSRTRVSTSQAPLLNSRTQASTSQAQVLNSLSSKPAQQIPPSRGHTPANAPTPGPRTPSRPIPSEWAQTPGTKLANNISCTDIEPPSKYHSIPQIVPSNPLYNIGHPQV
ncbi:hypothetical protein PtA15_5A254 [Puccinia triticina]|uniref:Uncharacterized protein n=1 Tax=Puccinia triticina TaxID=208348 RepID=A0ABY7CHH1_9BASI|nr:uncharacterized protein PtA15_5A254 [Puccinia triticina]WAQ84681.1 hypothetical protein PtA15_5A254 [Puccinia triticina]